MWNRLKKNQEDEAADFIYYLREKQMNYHQYI